MVKTVLAKLAKRVLKNADVVVALSGDDLRVRIAVGAIVVMDKTFDLLKDGVIEK